MSDARRLVMTRDQVAKVTDGNHQRIKEFEKLLESVDSAPTEPITVAITADTTYTLPNEQGTKTILIPKALLKASAGGPFKLTLTTGTGSTVQVPIGASTDTIVSEYLLFDVYIDSSSNVISKAWEIRGSNANGEYCYNYQRFLTQNGLKTGGPNGNAASGALFVTTGAVIPVTFPIQFSSSPSDVTTQANDDASTGLVCSHVRTALTASGTQFFLFRVANVLATWGFSWRAVGPW